jgi:hypothetical protein
MKAKVETRSKYVRDRESFRSEREPETDEVNEN